MNDFDFEITTEIDTFTCFENEIFQVLEVCYDHLEPWNNEYIYPTKKGYIKVDPEKQKAFVLKNGYEAYKNLLERAISFENGSWNFLQISVKCNLAKDSFAKNIKGRAYVLAIPSDKTEIELNNIKERLKKEAVLNWKLEIESRVLSLHRTAAKYEEELKSVKC